MIKEKIRDYLQRFYPALSESLSVDLSLLQSLEFEVETPKIAEHGDYSINLAFKLAKPCRKAPFQIAESILQTLQDQKDDQAERYFSKMQVAKPGFLNFFLSPLAVSEILQNVKHAKNEYGRSDYGKGKKVLLEFVSANPTGPLTIAHGRQAAVGDTLAAIMKKAGYQVHKEFYLNDGGNQIHTLGKSVFLRLKEVEGESIEFPDECYQGDYIIDIAKMILEEKSKELKESDDPEAYCAHYAADFMMQTIQDDLKEIEVVFDQYYSESTLYESKIAAALEKIKEKGFSYEKDGALWFRTTDFDDDKDRVLIKSDGSYTYLVPDIAYHRDKFDRGFEKVINLLGPDHHGYIKRLKASVKAMDYDPDALHVLIIQLTTLYKNGEPFRMSTRKGNFISLKELIDEVGADAARLFFLLKLTDSHLDFDLSLAKEKSQENPVYYFQYAYSRICSILRLSEIKDFEDANLDLLSEDEERILSKLIEEFPYVLQAASESLEPFRLVDYLRTITSQFHKYYNAHRVRTDDPELTKARLFLVSCIQTVIQNSLHLLGVSQPERM